MGLRRGTGSTSAGPARNTRLASSASVHGESTCSAFGRHEARSRVLSVLAVLVAIIIVLYFTEKGNPPYA